MKRKRGGRVSRRARVRQTTELTLASRSSKAFCSAIDRSFSRRNGPGQRRVRG
jgi:hypothetical protein